MSNQGKMQEEGKSKGQNKSRSSSLGRTVSRQSLSQEPSSSQGTQKTAAKQNQQNKKGRKRQRSDSGTVPCMLCKAKIEENSRALQCDVCENWACLLCSKVSVAMYEALNTDDTDETNFVWMCGCCKAGLPHLMKISRTLEEVKQAMMKELQTWRNQYRI
jgi:hypothetical protein